jgi:hypothetical protein
LTRSCLESSRAIHISPRTPDAESLDFACRDNHARTADQPGSGLDISKSLSIGRVGAIYFSASWRWKRLDYKKLKAPTLFILAIRTYLGKYVD